MFRPYELYVGLRYLRAKRRNHFISFISLISIVGITLGVMTLITVLSVMNGFEKELRERILSMASHATVSGYSGMLEDWEPVRAEALDHKRVVGAAPYVEKQAMLAHRGKLTGALLRGVDPELEPSVSDVGAEMKYGNLGDLEGGEYRIILGSELARELRAGVGDKIVVMISKGNVSPAGFVPRLRSFRVSGIFEVGMYEYDRTHAVIHIDDARRLYQMGEGVSGVRLKLDDLFAAPMVVRDLVERMDRTYYVSDWTKRHANFFSAIRTEKTVMFVILLLIVAVAAFNIVSTLVMVVTDKQADIAIMRTLGASPAAIMVIFMIQGTVIGAMGTLAGVALGLLLASNVESIVPALERWFSTDFLPADVYYISDLPSQVDFSQVLHIGVIAFVLTILSTIYPAWRAARTQPAEALRYE